MRIVVDGHEWNIEEARLKHQAPRLIQAAKRAVRQQSLAAQRRIKQEMPVDTGRARASWGEIWQEEEGGLSIVQGSEVEYIVQLNEGSSRQAPAGFIDVAARDAIDDLEDDLAAIMTELFS